MPTSPRSPQNYRPGLAARLIDGFRYGGGLGQWSWLLQRLTGLGIVFFLLALALLSPLFRLLQRSEPDYRITRS